MRNVTAHVTLSINLTADQWQLYRSVDGVEKAAHALNKGIEKVLNEAMSPGQGYEAACAVMRNFRKYGACDTEPMAVLNRLHSMRFPEGLI
jgi:hypothetical protein